MLSARALEKLKPKLRIFYYAFFCYIKYSEFRNIWGDEDCKKFSGSGFIGVDEGTPFFINNLKFKAV